MKLTVIFSSHLSDSENQAFIDHVRATAGNDLDLDVICIVNKNQYSLTQAYNMGWKQVDDAGRGDGIIVFCHNDIVFRTKDWGKLLCTMMWKSKFHIVGVAGATELNSHGCWWLTPNKEMNTKKMVGRVWHTNGLREWESIYTEKINGIREVLVVDGLFFAVKGTGDLIPFDETYKGFHYYDVSFSFANYLEGYNVGVTDRISIMHKSVGQTNEQWEMNRVQFSEQYKEELPTSVV